MRIAFVLTQSLESPSGLGRYWPIAKELTRLGHHIDILALHHNLVELDQRRFVKDGVTVYYAGQMHVRKIGPRKIYFTPAQLLIVSLASTLKLAYALARSNAEIIHLCKPQPINTMAAKLGRRGRPVFCDCDDYEAHVNRFSREWQRKVVTHFEDSIVDYVAGLTVNTQFTLARYRNLGFPWDRIEYVPNGVDRARFCSRPNVDALRKRRKLDEKTPLVSYVGSLSLASHPVDLLVEAFSHVARQCPDARLMLVGGGEDYDKLEQQAQHLGIADRTVFAGRVPPEEIPAYLALTTVTADPVHDDLVARARSPLKVVESLTMGVPVVTSDVGDRRTTLANGELGILVSPGDSRALADGLLAVLENPPSREHMSQAALACRGQWYWDYLVHDFARVYNDHK
jgi:glycosyltransferase involved in cell wall biosynthesis